MYKVESFGDYLVLKIVSENLSDAEFGRVLMYMTDNYSPLDIYAW